MSIIRLVILVLGMISVFGIMIGVPVGLLIYTSAKGIADPLKRETERKIAKKVMTWPFLGFFLSILLFIILSVIGNLSRLK